MSNLYGTDAAEGLGRAPIRVLQIEPVGGHRGMHYYDFMLGNALAAQGVSLVLLTCDETRVTGQRVNFPVEIAFRGIFGQGRALQRGVNYLRALWRIACRSLHPEGEIAHLHFFLLPPADYLFLRLLKRKGFRVVITAHDVVPFDQRPSAVLREIYRLADRIIVHAQANREELLARFAPDPARVEVIPMGHYAPFVEADLTESQAKARLGLSAEARVLLFFGQIKQVKGLDVLLSALPAVLRAFPDAVLVIAGAVWKDDWSRYDRLIAELGLREHVLTRIEHIPDEDVPLYFRAADVVALPYLRVYQSAVLFMACSYGRPVVATRTGGMAEVVRDGEIGYLVPPGDPETLAKAICRVLGDKERAEEMGRQAKRLVEVEYSWDSIAAKLRSVYAATLAESI